MEEGMSEGSEGKLARVDEEPTSGGEDWEFYAPATSASSATNSPPSSSSSAYQSSRIDSLRASQSAYESPVEFEIAASKSHWTELESDEEPECSPEDNLQYFNFLNLQYFNYRWDRRGYRDLLVGKKIAEGGQAEIYEATLGGYPCPLVAKVFKEGYSVRVLERQWPPEMLANWKGDKTGGVSFLGRNPLRLMEGAVLLNDERFNNRFAFVMLQAWGDLRKHIDQQMLKRKRGPPFSTEGAQKLLHRIAMDMFWLHEQGILHRDLKASNVLMVDTGLNNLPTYAIVSDFECSMGMVGTGFWRAPEILQQLKDGVPTSKMMFTTKADVYSFGMTCYEIVTGCTPFEGVPWRNYDHVLSGNQPTLPLDLDLSSKKMILSCWHLDPLKRPSFSEILSEIKPF